MSATAKKEFRPLTDREIKALKPADKPVTAFDGQGLYIEVSPKGKRVWRFKSKLKSGKSILMTLGEYPLISLHEARQKREDFRAMIVKGKDPRQEVKAVERAEAERREAVFRVIANEWLDFKSGKLRESTIRGMRIRLERYILPTLGNYPITEITARQVFELLREIEKKTASQASVCKSDLTRIFSYAIQLGMADRNPARDLVDVLNPRIIRSRATISQDEIADFLKALENDGASVVVKNALKIIMLLFMRKTELTKAEWSEIDLDNAVWTIPWHRMKMGRKVANPDKNDHVIPLPKQAVKMLKEIHRLTGTGKYVFSTGHHVKDAPLGDATLGGVITRLGYHGKMTLHGFRALATSWMDEQGYNRFAIERQLAHKEAGKTNQAYHRADYLDERRRMLQDWADHIDELMAQTAQQTVKVA